MMKKKRTQTELAEAAGISQPFLNYILNGKKRPSYKTAKRLAQKTRTPISLWIEGNPDAIRERVGL